MLTGLLIRLLSRPYYFKFFKGCLRQILLGPFLSTLSRMMFEFKVDQNGTKTKGSNNNGSDSSTSQESEKEKTKGKDFNQERKAGKPKVNFVIIIFSYCLSKQRKQVCL